MFRRLSAGSKQKLMSGNESVLLDSLSNMIITIFDKLNKSSRPTIDFDGIDHVNKGITLFRVPHIILELFETTKS